MQAVYLKPKASFAICAPVFWLGSGKFFQIPSCSLDIWDGKMCPFVGWTLLNSSRFPLSNDFERGEAFVYIKPPRWQFYKILLANYKIWKTQLPTFEIICYLNNYIKHGQLLMYQKRPTVRSIVFLRSSFSSPSTRPRRCCWPGLPPGASCPQLMSVVLSFPRRWTERWQQLYLYTCSEIERRASNDALARSTNVRKGVQNDLLYCPVGHTHL